MINNSNAPDINLARNVASSMLNETVTNIKRLTTSNMNYVFAINTPKNKYVLRMALPKYRSTYESAIYWQNKLLPLGVPLAEFIATDMEERFSQFPAVLMNLIPGDDLCNVYQSLSTESKQILSKQMVDIFSKADSLPEGLTYGFASSYEESTPYKNWLDFLKARLDLCRSSLVKTHAFPSDVMQKMDQVVKQLQPNLLEVKSKPFMWDASERNVLIYQNKISGIVDVDNMCFGDPLFTLGLTYIGLEILGCDDIYCDTWAALLNLDHDANLRLQFYRLFYTVWFMRHYADEVSENGTAYNMNAEILNRIYAENIIRFNQ